jgi:hypothetical protein
LSRLSTAFSRETAISSPLGRLLAASGATDGN